jgi:hypothetical protein
MPDPQRDDSTEFGEMVGDEDAQTPFELFRDKNMRDELASFWKCWTTASARLSSRFR